MVIIVDIIKEISETMNNIFIFKDNAIKYKSIVNICIEVLNFAKNVTLVADIFPILELKSLNAATHISLDIIKALINPIK